MSYVFKLGEGQMDWGNVCDEILRFLRENPEYRVVEARLWLYVLNSIAPQSNAHFRTMSGGVGQFLQSFKDMYANSLAELAAAGADDERVRGRK